MYNMYVVRVLREAGLSREHRLWHVRRDLLVPSKRSPESSDTRRLSRYFKFPQDGIILDYAVHFTADS